MLTFAKRFVIFLLLVFLAGWFLPGDFDAEAELVIDADRPLIHSYVADLRTWPQWTAWRAEDDPECVWTYEGPAAGAGMSHSWDGPKLDKGKLTITSSTMKDGIEFDLWFGDEPNATHGSITYADVDGGVLVTWRLWGDLPGYAGGWFALLMDSFATPDFDESLAGLKEACEGGLEGRLEAGAKEVLDALGT
ncbi:MAG: SRPBCC family protein [Planctomycetota bacterium]|nr:SRPBCC family protein [Planctomycetota bacterium]